VVGVGKPATWRVFYCRLLEANLGYLIVFLGGGIGAALRHGVNTLVPRIMATDFPFHTLLINIVGSVLMGLIAEFFALKSHLPASMRLFLTTGLLGGFTTFSAFSLETALLYERGEIGYAALYAVGSVVLAVGGLFLGLAVIRSLVEM
jgi:CrcB protein